MPAAVIATTDRLQLIEATGADIAQIIAWESAPENAEFVWIGTPEQHQAEIDDPDTELLIFRRRDNDRPIGYALCAIKRAWDVYELRRIVIAEKGQGFGREALVALIDHAYEDLPTHRFWLDVYPHNAVGRALYESVGLHQDGILRANYKDQRGYLDQVVYSMLRPEWESLRRTRPRGPYRVLIWDLGGTLIDTYPQVDGAFQRVVIHHGHEISLEDVSALTHQSTQTAITGLSERFGIPAQEFSSAQDRLKRSWETTPPPVMAGAAEVIQAARALGGLNLVVTHRDRASATALIESSGLAIDDMICAPDGFARKPDPQMHSEMIRRHRLDPATCLTVGDRTLDIEASRAAGIDGALLVDPRFATTTNSSAQDAMWTVTALTELTTHLG